MAFNVIAKSTLRAFWKKYADSQDALVAWHKLMTKSNFENFADLKESFSSADYVQPDYVIFNIKGNHYRLITRISFKYRTIWIKAVLTHKDYDNWTPTTGHRQLDT